MNCPRRKWNIWETECLKCLYWNFPARCCMKKKLFWTSLFAWEYLQKIGRSSRGSSSENTLLLWMGLVQKAHTAVINAVDWITYFFSNLELTESIIWNHSPIYFQLWRFINMQLCQKHFTIIRWWVPTTKKFSIKYMCCHFEW